MCVVTLLTDFGLDDYYVAAVKGTLLRLAPGCTLVDISHSVPPGDVELASFLLAAAAPSFPPGTIHLAVVDPGVGTSRRRLALAAAGQLFAAPDNGLLTPWLASSRPRAVASLPLDLPAPGATFHGRDRFAPLVAALLLGGFGEELGPEITDAVRLDLPRAYRSGRELVGRVAHIDRFGNLVTDLPSAWLPRDCSFVARVATRSGSGAAAISSLASCYAAISGGDPALLPGSLGTLEISLRGESAALRLGAARGDAVHVRFR